MFLPLGEVYAIVAKNKMRTIKRIEKGDDKDTYTLIPTNKSDKYSKQPIQKHAIDKVFSVLGCMKRL